MSTPLIVGLSGMVLDDRERAFLRDAAPLGIILFARNVCDASGLRRLVSEAREAATEEVLVFVDQEGGRVQRLRPPLAPRYPAAGVLGKLPEPACERAAWLCARLIAEDLTGFGIDSPCLPVADVPAPGAHDVIGDRAYADHPQRVAALAAAAAEGVLAGGCLPVVKHLPGHGRAMVDSHEELPVVDASRDALERDFGPFRALAGLPIAMTAHVIYTAIDDERPATLSPDVISLVRGDIGFDGLLLTDDIVMGAIGGDVVQGACAAVRAGCDVVLHCDGDIDAMEALAAALPPLSPEGERRLAAARDRRRTPADDVAALRDEFEAIAAAASVGQEG